MDIAGASALVTGGASGLGGSNGAATETGVPGTVGGYIVGSTSPTTVTTTMVGSGLQGVMFAVRFASIRLNKQIVGVKGCRTVRKADMVHNALLPRMEIDPQTYAVRADGVLLTCEPARSLPMAQRYFLF